MKWYQRARCRWLAHGDRNTKFFHALASSRARSNAITLLQHHGMKITSQQQIVDAFLEHYRGLMGTRQKQKWLDLSSLYEQHHDLHHLDLPFSEQEVLQAVNGLAAGKASGPDGLPNEFLKQTFQTLKPYIMNILHNFFQQTTDLTPLNQARIVLIPKSTTPQSVADYRPISVINLIPKIISKLLTNRIKPHMAALIDEHQTAFVQGRYIAENFLSVREAMHHVHRSKSPALLLKIDFTKAFDTVDWGFLMNVLRTRGCPTKFTQWVFHLLTTSSSTLQINGQQSPLFEHKRGLRQGDPLSPYLFILVADVLQRMTASISPLVSHRLSHNLNRPVLTFQYADDTVFLLTAKGPTIRLLLLVLHCFSLGSGLQINLAKCAMVPFSISANCIQRIQALIGCCVQELPITYLGMPLSLRSPRREDFSPLLNKFEQRLEGWRARFITRAGKLQLIKSVLSALPTYFMSCFRLPRWLIDRMDQIRRNFLWSKSHPSAGVHLINWQTVSLPRSCGGLGVSDLRLQNMSLLLRWWWTIFASDHRLWKTYATSIYAKHFPQPAPIILSKKGSFFWNSISSLRPLFHSCSQIELVSGNNTSFWFDGWDGLPLIMDSNRPNAHRLLSFSQARHCAHCLFDAPLTFRQHSAIQKLNSFMPAFGSDKLQWPICSSGSFTVKSVYKILSEGGKTRSSVTGIWDIKVTPSMKCFFYLLLHNKILTHDNLLRRHIPHVAGCVMCSGHLSATPETALHLFLQCPYADRIWRTLLLPIGYSLLQPTDSVQQTYLTSRPTDINRRKQWDTLFVTATWLLWKERNERTFRLHSAPVSVIVDRILSEAKLCLKYC